MPGKNMNRTFVWNGVIGNETRRGTRQRILFRCLMSLHSMIQWQIQVAWVRDLDKTEAHLNVSGVPSCGYSPQPVSMNQSSSGHYSIMLILGNIIELSLWAGLLSKCFARILSFSPHRSTMVGSIMSLILQMRTGWVICMKLCISKW